MREPAHAVRSAFTLIELLVVIAIIALLIGILLPALGAAREASKITADGARLQQLSVALQAYLNDYPRQLPQVVVDNGAGEMSVVGALFGGKKGQLPFLGIDEFGAERRPLNSYVFEGSVPPDSDESVFEMEVFRSPLDKGAGNTGLGFMGIPSTDSMYDLVGSSYTLNDHAPDLDPFGDAYPTLVPSGEGGRMPPVVTPTKTWVIGSHPIYNYDSAMDSEMLWFRGGELKANLAFLDGHVKMSLRVPEPPEGEHGVHTTDDYTYLPDPRWVERLEGQP